MTQNDETRVQRPTKVAVTGTPWQRSSPSERALLVAALGIWALVFFALGLMSITTQEAYIYASKSKALVKESMVYGTPAIWFGVMKIAMGLVPLALLMPSARAAAWWLVASMGILLVSIPCAILT